MTASVLSTYSIDLVLLVSYLSVFFYLTLFLCLLILILILIPILILNQGSEVSSVRSRVRVLGPPRTRPSCGVFFVLNFWGRKPTRPKPKTLDNSVSSYACSPLSGRNSIKDSLYTIAADYRQWDFTVNVSRFRLLLRF